MTRARLAALVAALASLVGAGAAVAVVPDRGLFTGKSSQGLSTEVRVDKHHAVKRFEIDWFAPCQKGQPWGTRDNPDGTRDQDLPGDPIKQSDDGSFSDSGKYHSQPADDGTVGHFTVNLHGRFTDRTHADGTFDVKVRVTRKGKTRNHCHAHVTWSVG